MMHERVCIYSQKRFGITKHTLTPAHKHTQTHTKSSGHVNEKVGRASRAAEGVRKREKPIGEKEERQREGRGRGGGGVGKATMAHTRRRRPTSRHAIFALGQHPSKSHSPLRRVKPACGLDL